MARILVVEDEPLVAHLVRRMLERAGYQVAWAPSGKAALEALGREAFDLVVCDLVMPGVSGLEVIREVRRLGGPPVLALSASVSAQSQEEALVAGAKAFLGKPFEGEALLAQVRRLLGETA
ncbi:response regulator [Thermus composti]|uniref:Response regulator n=1 Tax=Thermus composti TaxID=532059 RepID=A0ABV6PYW3_9DEIN|nr:response regulator [Thermus composti]GGM93611.1 response regulator [Thermus composti]